MSDQIPLGVMTDYKNRTVVSVANPRWGDAAHSTLAADVVFEELQSLGAVPFSTSAGADTEHGQQVWDNAIAGQYGPIAEYVAPDLGALDTDALNAALAQEGSVVRALAMVVFTEINKLRVKDGDSAYTLTQFKNAMKAQMR